MKAIRLVSAFTEIQKRKKNQHLIFLLLAFLYAYFYIVIIKSQRETVKQLLLTYHMENKSLFCFSLLVTDIISASSLIYTRNSIFQTHYSFSPQIKCNLPAMSYCQTTPRAICFCLALTISIRYKIQSNNIPSSSPLKNPGHNLLYEHNTISLFSTINTWKQQQ